MVLVFYSGGLLQPAAVEFCWEVAGEMVGGLNGFVKSYMEWLDVQMLFSGIPRHWQDYDYF